MSLATAFEKYFKVGAAISVFDLQKPNRIELLKNEFSSFTAENDMKPMYWLNQEVMQADPEKYNLTPVISPERAIPYLELSKSIGIPMRGHTLLWHNQTPRWFFHKNYDENAELADKETMLTRLDNYIHAVLDFVQTNYPGIIYAWDVVNEVVDEGAFRQKSPWYQICGTEFLFQAFASARKYAAPGVALFYNDYESATEWKRDFIIENVLKPLIAAGNIDGMGMQSHLIMDHPTIEEFKTAAEMYGALGLQVQITELDIHNADPSEESMHALAERYKALFEAMVDVKKSGKANITSVTFWNLLDETSWLTGFRRETSYPLLFHKEGEKKEAYYKVLEVVE